MLFQDKDSSIRCRGLHITWATQVDLSSIKMNVQQQCRIKVQLSNTTPNVTLYTKSGYRKPTIWNLEPQTRTSVPKHETKASDRKPETENFSPDTKTDTL
ncbi:hypothetical protein BgiBS90_012681 [Biomphalaria glabrata]|nr:hypothetical protein BgiBS90_012681 [Biomphalaria glabrata]